MRDGFRGRGRGRGGGGWRGSQRATIAESHEQQWKSGLGLVPGQESRHFNPREARARPEREAEPPHGSVPMHSTAPHRRRHQGQGLRKERAAPYEARAGLLPHGVPPGAARVPPLGLGGRVGAMEVVDGQLACAAPLQGCSMPAVCCSVYADQIIDYYTGRICPRRFCVAYNEVCKLVRLPEAPAAPPQQLPPAALRGVEERVPEGGPPGARSNGALPGAAALEAEEMSEVSQVEEGEVDEEGPALQALQQASLGQLQGLPAAFPPQAAAAAAAAVGKPAPALTAAADPAQHVAQGPQPASPPFQQQQQQPPAAAPSTVRRDPRLAARARAETSAQRQQQQQQQEAAAQPLSAEATEAPQPQPEPQEPQESPCQQPQQQQQQAKWDPSVLPPQLRRQPLLSGKLPLLLDLDNTLLHAQAVGVAGYNIALEDWLDEDGLPEVYKFELPCNRKVYYLKLRPGLRRFLKALAPVFELSIYTNATQEYADLVVAILDPDRSLFGDRIVARESSGRGEQTENKTVRCLYGDLDRRCVVAFDDRQNIWTDLPVSHVVKAQHYDFFDSSRPELLAHYPHLPLEETLAAIAENPRQRATALDRPSPVPAAMKHLNRPYDWDRHMQHMINIFLKVHQEFFKDPWNANVGTIISGFQSRVLAGVGLFLTGYRKSFAPGSLVADCEERQAELAQRLGATVYRRFDEPGVTHVMAGKSNTNNMLALKERSFQHLKKVHTLWLFACESMWAKAPESCFDADALCALYDNQPPCAPFKDHWMHLAEFVPPPAVAPAQPLPLQDRLPVREFLGTGPYSDGASLISPFEETIFLWRPEKQPIRQLYSKASTQHSPPTLAAGSPHPQQQLQQQLLPLRPEGQNVGQGREEMTARSGRQEAEVMPFCNFQVYAV
ncbi:NLI interacting factor-like phosphatase domain-containing protein, putative [Eimeria tenella]|uniref:protein-serine/threonine phosphatase n=1 Tax=Eimeria tenella TaxID=5802 RepID=U6L1E2_EIMTE|nr:NLI interacting factor-like phosphatase domain-containing protein, putative [Eimeria tenella]CDJ42404.1 NLI interacting factor-like phosphatase domain-containing protein, putative [Eimeria tenella]|eukprot:XP_013233154.1 NLI interacting factor-like phosphatase domain-containing protein, putative [Eimeria tenella]